MTVLHPTQMKVIEECFIWTDKLFPAIVVTSCSRLVGCRTVITSQGNTRVATVILISVPIMATVSTQPKIIDHTGRRA
jgi:hypothetical protein